MDLPEFHGRLNPEEFLEWLSAIEKFFDYKETPASQRVKLVATRLRGYASTWWDQVQEVRLRKGKPKISSWEKMKTRLKEKFIPPDFAQSSFSRYNNLRQEAKNVVDYTEEFYKLVARNDVQETEEQLTAWYIGGLKTHIRDEVEMHRIWKVTDAYQLALKVEAKLSRTGARRAADVRSFHPSFKGESFRSGASNLKIGNEVQAASKSAPGSGAANLKTEVGGPSSCFTCGKPGHRYRDCPRRQPDARVAFGYADHEEDYFDDALQPVYDREEEVEREEIEPEVGESLVIHRVLTTPKADLKEDWPRSSIFKTRCKSHDKVCTIVIDGGSCENIVAQDMVDKLQLQTEPHPRPYRIAWFNKDSEVKVSKRCLVSFSMGKKYRDQVWCDIVPMDVCHILLGRPWQYDRHTIHDGRKNTYTFKMGKTEIVLLPSKDEPTAKSSQEEGSKCLTMSKFMKESEECGVMFILLAKDFRCFEVPRRVQPLLE